jgi:hypothetical protein
MSFVLSVKLFRPEYKYRNPPPPGYKVPYLVIFGLMNLGESQLQDLRDLGYEIRSQLREHCVVSGKESDLPRIAQIWWVKHVYQEIVGSPDAGS